MATIFFSGGEVPGTEGSLSCIISYNGAIRDVLMVSDKGESRNCGVSVTLEVADSPSSAKCEGSEETGDTSPVAVGADPPVSADDEEGSVDRPLICLMPIGTIGGR